MTEGAQEGIDEVPGAWKSAMGNDIVLQTIEEGEGSDKSKVAEYLSVVTFDAKGYFLEGGGGASGMMSENKVRSDAPFENTTGQRVQAMSPLMTSHHRTIHHSKMRRRLRPAT